jgi:3-deoxy-D-manno-octulosonic-acid transferase
MHLGAFWHPKLRLGALGRHQWREQYAQAFQPVGPVLWMHVASLGEFEQGRPIIEAFKKQYPEWQVVLTFFSPSGYELRKNYPLADFVAYLPLDSPANARDFIQMIQPSLAIFVKYEFWANYLFELKRQQIPTILVAALFRPDQLFFKWYGGFWRKKARAFSHIFTQTADSAELLKNIGCPNVSLAGDPRVDRVLQIATEAQSNRVVADFADNAQVLVVGSSWPKDEQLLLQALKHPDLQSLKVIIAPHEPSERHVAPLHATLGAKAVRYSQSAGLDTAALNQYQWLIIDNIGLLNTLYKYGHLAYIGGGFGVSIHNTLEPAAFGLPVVFGPVYHKFEEAKQLIARGGAAAVESEAALTNVLLRWTQNAERTQASNAVQTYMQESRGGTNAIFAWIAKMMQESR